MEENRKLTEEDLDNMVPDDIPDDEEELSPELQALFAELIGEQPEEQPTEEQSEGGQPTQEEEAPLPEDTAEVPPTEEQPTEQPEAESEAEPEPDTEKQTSEQENGERLAAQLNEIVQSVINEMQTEQGVEVNPELVAKTVLKYAQSLGEKGKSENDGMTERERTLSKKLEETILDTDLLQEMLEMKNMPDFPEHEADMKKLLSEMKDKKRGMYREAYDKVRSQKYKPEKQVLGDALKNPETLKTLAEHPELKKIILEAAMKNQDNINVKIPPVSPQSGGALQEEVRKPKNFDEAFDLTLENAGRKRK